MSNKPKVLRLGEINHAQESWNALSELAALVEPRATKRADFLEECKSGQLDGVTIIFRTFDSVSITGFFDEELINALPSSVQFIAHNGAGYDQVQIAPCTKRGIQVSNVPTAVDDSTADTAIFLLLGALRNFNSGMTALRQGLWRGNPPASLGHDPQHKILGILGLGGIGRNFALKARALGMSIAYHNRNRLPPDQEDGAKYLSFEKLLSSSDVLSIHVPLNDNTKHLISTKQFNLMKKGVVIVNTARGAVIDEKALVKALDDGVVASAGLDVYEDEPEIHEGLLRNSNVVLVPHMGTWTIETIKKMEEWCIENVSMALKTGRLKSIVPEQKNMASNSSSG